ncbi:hypothetical protein A2239_04415 [Candidatus Uhrbacteria bacterium RIFOXYA2_FULL_40_9]|nr:MAG: hypothetical protein UT94_C0058G0003 [Candidatus Uhrbacteria bacterium GW2011_GWF2_40_263]OGL93637.1 MAG: hypothetical protein A2239_04415 [Candidatus Uhrbacteria bacterium RIFOXYA2_FULL_40_9]OGL97326.1 MAG: hypothetical protein A2332_03635 [Candidatus Uhrbacteria bacterium RIFOXYB2_FULL_41_18]HBK34895.1 hypothetical protein [Candidatus Uhrbacteria bacterium]HCB56132.1 hypothetical protein [Candidatus Uhrbacteria bacterium]
MESEPRQPQGLELYISDLQKEQLTPADIMPAIEGLDDPDEMRAYFDAMKGMCKKAVDKDIRDGKESMATSAVRGGRDIEEVADDLAKQHMRRIIGHYNNSDIHKKWNEAVDGLETSGGFSNMY